MNRRTRESINSEVELLDGELEILSRREAELQRIIGEIQKLKDEVSSKKATLTEKRNELESQKEPINWLPPELLVNIFLAFAAFDFEDLDYRPPVVISHTCTKWRAIALSTSHLWSRLWVLGSSNKGLAQTFFQRSGIAPLEVGFFSVPSALPSAQCEHMDSFLVSSRPHFSRIERLSLQCQTAASLLYILPFIQAHTSTFPNLRQLTLSISSPNPSFLEAPELMLEGSATPNSSPPPTRSSKFGGLLYLKLEKVPLFRLPATLIASLKTLELTYAPRKTYSSRDYYFLRMSTLCRFLSLTPLLEELVLSNTVPYFDVTLPQDGGPVSNINGNANSSFVEMNPVVLKHLKSIDWTYPHTGDVARFLSMIEASALERLDLWVEEIRPKRHGCDDLLFTRGYSISSSPHKLFRGFTAAIYPALKDLSLQCAGDDTAACVLRKFSVPALERVAFTNIDTDVKKGETSSLPVFPRLESIFRDPRLPHLTHLTLSHFRLSSERGRVEAMLGYMPLLTSLTLDTCLGVERLMEALQESLVGTIKPHDKGGGVGRERGTRSHCGVKVCPRLEALSFWGCQDVTLNSLSAVILSRNRRFSHEKEELVCSERRPNGATQPVTRDPQTGKESDGHRVEETQMGREIKPLRRTRRHGPEPALSESKEGAVLSPSTNIVSTIIARQEALQPAHIIYVRVDNCKLIERAGALRFRDLGVVDLVWVGSD
ncbi:hypothetical protein M413DRAFT_449199 [Hebeloma cylindrosporum]|uniref:Uncharacterized protein n=1 Tax=Hebeloma cylindrosporum TaxID=76867 RepID=A0A0C3BW53_HEBCY|nr:hypothetical protein M413DRAFT_449199 [Hebeloma cylindrosporum h7]